MATISTLGLSTPKFLGATSSSHSPRPINFPISNSLWARYPHIRPGRVNLARPVRAVPDQGLSQKVEESIKKAEEACGGDAVSGECVAAWDEVEELSAAASHARDKNKGSDPLEAYCKDNPEANECRTYDD